MMSVITKAALVVLAGIYAMRVSSIMLQPAALTPLWFVACSPF
jgi:hypothetical protein